MKEIRLTHETARNTAISIINQIELNTDKPMRVIIDEDKRSNAQNRMMWSVLSDISKQVKWDNETLTKEEWKDLITANLYGQKARRGIEGGLVFTGKSTKTLSKKDFANVVTSAEQFGAENNVTFSNDAKEAIRVANEYKHQFERLAK